MQQRKTMYPILSICLISIITLWGCSRTSKRNSEANEKNSIAAEKPVPSVEITKPAINVYIENSGSMDGYVKGVTDFKHAVYSYLSDIKISTLTREINLFYINSKIIPYGSDISDFIEKLDPNSFRVRGGNRGTSDISNVLDSILSNTEENTISMLVSDCIFSPGKGKDADQYLINQQIGIKTNFAKYLWRNANSAICVYQLSSQFDGYYYNREDAKKKINDRRPFYIWIIGDKKQVTELSTKIPVSKIKGGGIENTFIIMQGNQTIDYAIRPGTGKFSLDKKEPKKKIVKAKKGHSGKLSFAVNADFSQFLLGDKYLTNVDNYTLNDKDYILAITNSPQGSGSYTHSLNLSSEKVKPSYLSIKLKTHVPEWVERMNDNVGLDIHADESMHKTYGIKYLINGVYEAFTQHNDFYTEIKIGVNN